MSLNIHNIQRLKSSKNHRAEKVISILRNKERVLGVVLLGNTSSSILASFLFTRVVFSELNPEMGFYGVIILTFVMLIFGEIVPKFYASRNPDTVSLRIVYVLSVFITLLSPAVYLVEFIARGIFSLINKNDRSEGFVSISDTIKSLVELHAYKKGGFSDHLLMLRNVADVFDIEVAEVMTHRKNVVTVDIEDDIDEILNKALSSGFSRIPVFDKGRENLLSVLYVKSLSAFLFKNHNKDFTKDELFKNCCIEPWFIPETAGLLYQLKQFRAKKIHFAVVINEFGSFQGIVTLEDLLEEIVGSIYDEYDIENKMITKLKDNSYIINGDCNLRDLEQEINISFNSEDASTALGLIMSFAKRLPLKGEVFEFSGIKCVILSIEENDSAIHLKKIK